MSQSNFMEKLLEGVEVEWKLLGDVADVGTGHSNRQDENENGEYPFSGSNDVPVVNKYNKPLSLKILPEQAFFDPILCKIYLSFKFLTILNLSDIKSNTLVLLL
jgi:hypothetical protein